jgi:hypothetical protein
MTMRLCPLVPLLVSVVIKSSWASMLPVVPFFTSLTCVRSIRDIEIVLNAPGFGQLICISSPPVIPFQSQT